ncbi:MAG TPA: lipocalin family protein [Flavobacteriaceae bacterium]|nr:lipocalin family protein [Flavobacteriaceae bacterium]MCB9212233.1 lipocalin family protein [Alteromonas sp.]HPF10388.1 lipocalin family protein [Flavobacteriaceae bacterium]HQU20452.1 lipocalin family protein [Flavobacteriaceae bacterium]HQU64599.1 lipocalin family protein [Flavobacteriaceae bacterium]
MKKLILIVLAVTLVLGCSKDDDNKSSGTTLEGTWKLTSFTVETAYDLNEDGTATNDVMAETNCYQNETIEFESNNSGTLVSRSYADISLDLVIGTTNDYEYTVTCVQQNDETAFTWSKSGNSVTITVSGVPFTATLSGNTLTLVIPQGYTVEVEQGNGTAFVTEDITYVFTKQ